MSWAAGQIRLEGRKAVPDKPNTNAQQPHPTVGRSKIFFPNIESKANQMLAFFHSPFGDFTGVDIQLQLSLFSYNGGA